MPSDIDFFMFKTVRFWGSRSDAIRIVNFNKLYLPMLSPDKVDK